MAMTLEPCPFCGKEGPFDQWPCEWLDGKGDNVVRCPWCHGAAPLRNWNRRAHLTQPAQAVDGLAQQEAWRRALSAEKAGCMADSAELVRETWFGPASPTPDKEGQP
jgi:hypothetical protein